MLSTCVQVQCGWCISYVVNVCAGVVNIAAVCPDLFLFSKYQGWYALHTQSLHDTHIIHTWLYRFIGICWTGNEAHSCHSWHIIRPTPAHPGWSSSQRIRTRATRHIITAQCCVSICVSVYAIYQFLCDHCDCYGTAVDTSFAEFILILCLLAV